MGSGNQADFLEAQARKLGLCRVRVLPIDLVDHHHHVAAGFSEAPGDLFIAHRQAIAGIDHEHNGIRLGHGHTGLPAGQVGQIVLAEQAAGVDQYAGLAFDDPAPIAPVAGEARHISYDGIPGTGQPVEQRRLADIGAADKGKLGGHRSPGLDLDRLQRP